MSKAYFDLDIQGKKDLKAKRTDNRPEAFSSTKSVEEIKTTVETTTAAPAVEEEVIEEYPLNED
jgi:hypothetical protein